MATQHISNNANEISQGVFHGLHEYPWLINSQCVTHMDMQTGCDLLKITVWPPFNGRGMSTVNVQPLSYYYRLSSSLVTGMYETAESVQSITRDAARAFSDAIAERAAAKHVPINSIRDCIRFSCPRIEALEHRILADRCGWVADANRGHSTPYSTFNGRIVVSDDIVEELVLGSLDSDTIWRHYCTVSLRDNVLWGDDDMPAAECWARIFGG